MLIRKPDLLKMQTNDYYCIIKVFLEKNDVKNNKNTNVNNVYSN